MCSNVRIVVIVGCALLALAMATPGQAVLIHQWNLDDGPPATTVAPTVGGITGTINGNVTWQAGGPPSSVLPAHHLSFGGTPADYVDLSNDPSLEPAEITIAFWAKADDAEAIIGKVMMGKYLAAPGSFEFAWGNNGNLFFRMWNTSGGQVFAGNDAAQPDAFHVDEFADDQWHHIAGSYDGSNVKVYGDGVLIESLALAAPRNTTDAALLLGRRNYPAPWESPFPGELGGPVQIYNNALSDAEIAELATPIPEPSTITLLAVLLAGLGIAVSRRRA